MLVPEARSLMVTTEYHHDMTMLQTATDIDTAIDNMVNSIVQGWDPLQIVLFGSRARGDHRVDSDVDLLVVLDQCEDRTQARTDICRDLPNQGIPTDVFVTTPALWLKRAGLVGAIERRAMIDGRILYVRGGGDPVIEEALEMLRFSREDLGAAEFLFQADSQPPRQACFFAQQAAEKALKAALELEHDDYPHTHQLKELLNQLPSSWPTHALDLNLEWLSKLVTYSRYPGANTPPTRAHAVEAVADARLIVEAVVEEFKRRGVDVS